MKVILLENLKKIGSIGEIIDVKRGFARNFLIANKKLYMLQKNNSLFSVVNLLTRYSFLFSISAIFLALVFFH